MFWELVEGKLLYHFCMVGDAPWYFGTGYYYLWAFTKFCVLQISEKDIPGHFLDEGRQAKEASSSGAQVKAFFFKYNVFFHTQH